jgi:hypothetical protein
MEVQQNHFQYVMHWQLCVFCTRNFDNWLFFVLMLKGKLIGNTDGLWDSVGAARPPISDKTHLSRCMNIALGRCEYPPELGFSPKGGLVASKSD